MVEWSKATVCKTVLSWVQIPLGYQRSSGVIGRSRKTENLEVGVQFPGAPQESSWHNWLAHLPFKEGVLSSSLSGDTNISRDRADGSSQGS